jgi:hypothetical protein
VANLAESTGESLDVIRQIREGTHLPNTELIQALGVNEKPSLRPSFSIGQSKSLLGAHFRIFPEMTFGISHQQYLANWPPHNISE